MLPGVRIRVTDPSSTARLILFLRNSGIVAFRDGEEGVLTISGDTSPEMLQAVLTAWNALPETSGAGVAERFRSRGDPYPLPP
jgi:hypothetical protein